MAGGTALRVPVNFVQVMQRGGEKRGEGGKERTRSNVELLPFLTMS